MVGSHIFGDEMTMIVYYRQPFGIIMVKPLGGSCIKKKVLVVETFHVIRDKIEDYKDKDFNPESQINNQALLLTRKQTTKFVKFFHKIFCKKFCYSNLCLYLCIVVLHTYTTPHRRNIITT